MACEDWFYGRRFTDRETRIMVDSITQLSCILVKTYVQLDKTY